MKIEVVMVKNCGSTAWYTDGVNWFYGTNFLWGNSAIYGFRAAEFTRKIKEFGLKNVSI